MGIHIDILKWTKGWAGREEQECSITNQNWALPHASRSRRTLSGAPAGTFSRDAGYACFWAGNGGNGGVLAQASGECWRDCFVQPDGGRWSNLICSHRADVLAIFRNDTARRVKTYPRARQKVCATNVRREGEPSFG